MQGETRPADATKPAAVTKYAKRLRKAIVAAMCISGAAALVYEVTWTRELQLIFGSSIYAVSIMLTAFMAGLSLGGHLGGRRADQPGVDLVLEYVRIEFAIGVFGMLTIPLIAWLPRVYFALNHWLAPPEWVFFGIQLLLSFAVMIAPTTLMGATFPIAAKLMIPSQHGAGRAVGSIYSFNTLGSVAGSLGAGFLLIPVLGVRGAVMTAAALNLLVSMLILWGSSRGGWSRRLSASALTVALGIVLVLAFPPPVRTLGFNVLSRVPDYEAAASELASRHTVFDEENAYSRVVVLEDANGGRSLVNGGLSESSSSSTDRATTQLLAVLPYLYAQQPKDAFVVGLGTGYTSEAALDLPLDAVETAEINPAVVSASHYFVGDELTTDRRWELDVGDARGILAAGDERFDIITSEPSWPLDDAVAPLFTLEFFEIARDSLDDGGVFCQWLPQYLLKPRDFQMMYRTFHQVFPNSYVWTYDIDGVAGGDLFLIGVKNDVPVDDEAIHDAANAAISAELDAQVDVHPLHAPKTISGSLTDPTVPLNTDDRPLLEIAVVENLVAEAREVSQAQR